MTVSPSVPTTRRNPLLLLVGGCALVSVCILSACALFAVLKFSIFSFPSAEPPPSQDVIQDEWAALPSGNAANGPQLFSGSGCAACHSLAANQRIVGPSLLGIATRAATRKTGYSATLYLYESIAYPRAFVVSGF